MRILVTNDDGIHAEGLWNAVNALTTLGDVAVVAPDRDQSGIGAAKTLQDVVRTHNVTPRVDGVEAISVEGTPSDCVILATESLFQKPFDLVVSGVNRGANLGLDIINSGTVGATIQAYFRNIPSIAISVASLTNVQYQAAGQTVNSLAQDFFTNAPPRPLILNVNLPNLSPERIKGVKVTRLGPRAYLDSVERGGEEHRSHFWIRHNRPASGFVPTDTDVWAVRNSLISITPLVLTFTYEESDSTFQDLASNVAAALDLDQTGSDSSPTG